MEKNADNYRWAVLAKSLFWLIRARLTDRDLRNKHFYWAYDVKDCVYLCHVLGLKLVLYTNIFKDDILQCKYTNNYKVMWRILLLNTVCDASDVIFVKQQCII